MAAIRIYGLIAYSVGQRVHEIGIRMVLSEGLKMTAVGGAIGLAMALPFAELVAIGATCVPARRAAQFEPMSALRQE